MKIPAGTPPWFLLYVLFPLCVIGIVVALCGIFKKPKKRVCSNCTYGEINFWEYTECWKFNQEIDGATTSETADREMTVERLTKEGECQYYE